MPNASSSDLPRNERRSKGMWLGDNAELVGHGRRPPLRIQPSIPPRRRARPTNQKTYAAHNRAGQAASLPTTTSRPTTVCLDRLASTSGKMRWPGISCSCMPLRCSSRMVSRRQSRLDSNRHRHRSSSHPHGRSPLRQSRVGRSRRRSRVEWPNVPRRRQISGGPQHLALIHLAGVVLLLLKRRAANVQPRHRANHM